MLSDVRYRGGPRPGPYFTRMVVTGRGFRTLTYTYKVFRGGRLVFGGWEGGTSWDGTGRIGWPQRTGNPGAEDIRYEWVDNVVAGR